MRESRWTKLSKSVGLTGAWTPTPSVAEVEAALAKDEREQIFKWWRFCQVGTFTGDIGKAMSGAIAEVHRRCDADDAEEEHAHRERREGDVSASSDSGTSHGVLRANSSSGCFCGELGK